MLGECDKSQLNLMIKSLQEFENGRLGLSGLVGNLEFLFHAMESAENEWDEQFLEEVTRLESVNAVFIMSEAGEPVPFLGEQPTNQHIDIAVKSLLALIAARLNNIVNRHI